MPDYNGFEPDVPGYYIEKPTAMSVGSWVGTILLSALPIVGLILCIIWAVNPDRGHIERKNYAIAMIIFNVVVIILNLLTGGTVLGILSVLA